MFQTAHVRLVREVSSLARANTLDQVPPHNFTQAEFLLQLVAVTVQYLAYIVDLQ